MIHSRLAMRARIVASMVAATFVVAGCTTHGSGVTASGAGSVVPQARNSQARPSSDGSVLNQLTNQVVIGSTIDPGNGARNPYGLTVAPATNGKLSAGDLV